MTRFPGRWSLVLAAAAAGGPAVAQAPPPPKVAARVAVAPPAQVFPDDQFENWAMGGGAVRSVDGARQRFAALLVLQLEEIDRACQLTAAQKAKLRLMGAGDTKRLLDDLAEAKRRFNQLGNDMQQLQQVVPLVQPIQRAVQTGPFQPGSLFAKSLKHTLTAEQGAKYDAVVRERRAFHHQAQIELAVNTLEETVPLRDAQRTALIALLVKETRPTRASGSYDFYLLMYQLSRLPEGKVKSLLTDPQWKAWTGLVGRYQGVIQNLRQSGGLIDDDDLPPEGLKK